MCSRYQEYNSEICQPMTCNPVHIYIMVKYIMVEIITVDGRYSAIQYNVLHAVLQRLGQNVITGWTHKGHPPYLSFTGELWSVFCEGLRENWQRYNGTELCILNTQTVMWDLHARMLHI